MKSKPAVKIAIPFITGIIIGNVVAVNTYYCLMVTAILCLFLLWSFRYENSPFVPVLIIALIISLGFLSITHDNENIKKINSAYRELYGRKVDLIGWITDRKDYYNGAAYVTIKPIMLKVDDTPIGIQGKFLIIRNEEKKKYDYGDLVRAQGMVTAPRAVRNPGGFNYKKYLNRQGVYAILRQRSEDLFLIKSGDEGNVIRREIIMPVKKIAEERINASFGKEEAEILKAVLIGEREGINPEIREAFTKSGIIHILAVSGLHVGFVVFFLVCTAKIFSIRRTVLFYLLVPCLLLYVILTGARPPVIRASLMTAIIFLGYIVQRKSDAYNSLGVAALLILFWKPSELFNPGFLLSFTAVVALVFFGSLVRNSVQVKINQKAVDYAIKYIIYSVLVSAGILFVTSPITGFYFSRISVLSILLNFIFIPGFGIIIGLTVLSLLGGVIFQSLAQLFNEIAERILQLLIELSRFSSELPVGTFTISREEWFLLTVSMFSATVFYLMRKTDFVKRTVIIMLTALNFLMWGSLYFRSNGKLELVFFDVGQGDACLIRFPAGDNIVVDTGVKIDDFTAAQSHILPYFMRNGIRRISRIILSHNHADHTGGCQTILKECTVDEIVIGDTSFVPGNKSLCSEMNDRNNVLKQVAGCDKIVLGKNKYLFILNPMFLSDKLSEDNKSLVILLVYGRNKILFTGDISKESEELLLCWGEVLKSDVMKVPHHGSKNSSTQSFVDKVKPGFAVISVGEFNPYNHPSNEVMERYGKYNTRILRTDKEGAIVFRCDGEKIEMINYK